MASIIQRDNLNKSQIQICQSVIQKYPHMVPVFLETHRDIECKRQKILISKHMTGLNFTKYLNRYVQKSPTASLYVFVKDMKRKKQFLFQSTMTFSQNYEKYRNEQTGYLHLLVLPQHSF